MAFFFPQFIRDQLTASATFFNGKVLGMALFHQAPSFTTSDPRYLGVQTVADLKAMPGWVEAVATGYPLSDDVTLLPAVVGTKSSFVKLNEFTVDADMLPVQVRAVAFFIRGTVGPATNPIVFVTNTPVTPVATMRGKDSITSVPDPVSLGAGPNNKWLFGWANTNRGGTMVEGALGVSKFAPEFEPAHTQHVWLFPQRVNLVANPNFELGVNHWRTNGVVDQITEGDTKLGRFTGSTLPLVVESNKFPGRISNDWTIRVKARGVGKLKIGLVSWDVGYDETTVDWGVNGGEEWKFPQHGYANITALRNASEIYEGQLRLETDSSELVIDQVICEPGFLLGWDYFDGDTTYGARDDYSWYGGENLKGQTYSLWYNNKRATAGRLFATKFPDRAAITNEDELAEGLVYQWVPAGTLVEPHWDVLFAGDLQHPVTNNAGTPVTPYRTTVPGDAGYDADMGVDNPWPV